VILNEVRMNKALANTKLSSLKIVTGLATVSDEFSSRHEISSVPCLVTDHEIKIQKTGISIPSYDVGMYAIAISYLHNPDVIFLTGFDGYDDPENPLQRGMEKYLNDTFIRSKLISITPTRYTLDISPVYNYID
jgi:hypothetical protein